jgi:hypothetical protein
LSSTKTYNLQPKNSARFQWHPQEDGVQAQLAADLDSALAPLPLGELKTESCSDLRSLPHCGHFTFASEDKTSASYLWLHDWHTYS